MGASFRALVQQDLANMLDDEVVYFGKTIKVKIFESLDDPGIANKGGILTYFIGNASHFIGIKRNQNVKIDGIDHTIISFRENPNGGIVVTYNKASGK